jgi:protein phosphatase PTC2/3
MAEISFMRKNLETVRDKSGSCAIISLLTDKKCYVANVGDSRIIMSENQGKNLIVMSNDYKPGEDAEQRRIIQSGGKVYQSANINITDSKGNKIIPPVRVLPGRLSVSRTFGDCMAKIERYGGNPNCIIAVPEITVFDLQPDIDFILLGSDGIFDKLENKVVQVSVLHAAR